MSNKNKYKDKFDKLVDEEEMEEMYSEDEYESCSVSIESSLMTEIKGLKILLGVSICISILSFLLSVIILSKVNNGTYNSGNNGSENNSGNNANVDYDTSMFTEITIDQFMDLYKKDEKSFVYTGRSTCGYCVAFLPYLQQSVSEYKYTLYYLDIDKISNDDLTEIAELHKDFSSTIGATPMVYVMGNKDVEDVNQGYTEYAEYAKFLEKNGIKKR